MHRASRWPRLDLAFPGFAPQNDSCLNTTTPYAATTDAADTAGAADAAAGGAGTAVLALPAMSMTTTAHTPGCTGSACSEGWQEENIVEFYCDPTTLPKVQQATALMTQNPSIDPCDALAQAGFDWTNLEIFTDSQAARIRARLADAAPLYTFRILLMCAYKHRNCSDPDEDCEGTASRIHVLLRAAGLDAHKVVYQNTRAAGCMRKESRALPLESPLGSRQCGLTTAAAAVSGCRLSKHVPSRQHQPSINHDSSPS